MEIQVSEDFRTILPDTIAYITTMPSTITQADKELILRAQAVRVMDDTGLVMAGDIYNELVSRRKVFAGPVDAFDEKKKAAKKVLDSVYSLFKSALIDPFKNAEDHVGQQIGMYQQKKEEERKAEEFRLQREAAKREEDERIAKAASLEQQNRREEADQVLSEPIHVPVVEMPRTTPKISGVATQTYYSAEVVDARALFQAVHEGKVPMMAFVVNEPFLNRQATLLKETMNYPGVVVRSRVGIKPTGR